MILFTRRIWGFRLIDVMGFGLLIALILSVYLAKTIAGRERGEIARVEDEIVAEHERIRLLQAEVAHLERPERIEHLSGAYLGLGPVKSTREVSPEALSSAMAISQAASQGGRL
jgi:hypothetical protein